MPAHAFGVAAKRGLSLSQNQIEARPRRAISKRHAARRVGDAVGMLRVGAPLAREGDDAVVGEWPEFAGVADAVAVLVVPEGQALEFVARQLAVAVVVEA